MNETNYLKRQRKVYDYELRSIIEGVGIKGYQIRYSEYLERWRITIDCNTSLNKKMVMKAFKNYFTFKYQFHGAYEYIIVLLFMGNEFDIFIRNKGLKNLID